MRLLLLPLLLFVTTFIYAQVGIGTTSPSSASMLEISAGTTGDYKGFLPPRVALTANQASIAPAISDIGLIVFVEETGCLDFWNGTAWENIYCTGGVSSVWINEFRYYDNVIDDEFIEIAGVAGTDISGYYIAKYNGGNNLSYGALLALNGVIPDEENGFGTISIAVTNLQNAVDGFALVGPDGKVIQFLSYEGSFTASGGPAHTLTSIDVGIVQDATTTNTQSIHLTGTGNTYSDFTWSASAVGDNTPGLKNIGQTFN